MKTNPGRFFEDYRLNEVIRHAVPRTLSGVWIAGLKIRLQLIEDKTLLNE